MILPVICMAPPPEKAEIHAKIERVAEEIEARVDYTEKLMKGVSFSDLLLNVACQSEMSDAAFRLFYCLVKHAKPDGTTDQNPDQEYLVANLGRTGRSLLRAKKELEKKGWLETKRQRHAPAMAIASIPAHIRERIVNEILQVTNLSPIKKAIELPNFSRPRLVTHQQVTDSSVQEIRTTPVEVTNTSPIKQEQVTETSPIKTDLSPVTQLQVTDSSPTGVKSVTCCPSTNSGNTLVKNNNNITLSRALARGVEELEAMRKRMEDAGGDAIANPACAPGLLGYADLERWLNGGCDFEKDILPGIRKSAYGRPSASVRSWFYFERAVIECRDARLREIPPPQVNGFSHVSPQEIQEKRERKRAIFAKFDPSVQG